MLVHNLVKNETIPISNTIFIKRIMAACLLLFMQHCDLSIQMQTVKSDAPVLQLYKP